MPTKQIVIATKAPQVIGPYSSATKVGAFIFTAGQLGLNPETGELVAGGIEAETRQALTNLKVVLEAAGASLDQVVKTTVFLRNMIDFGEMNAVYGEFFKSEFPARSTVAVSALPKNSLVEIEAIACLAN